MEITDPSHFGTTTFEEPETVETAFPSDPQRKIALIREYGQWRPPERLARFLPNDFCIPLECKTYSDGLRRIVPRCNFEELIDHGAVGGLAVLHGMHGFDKMVDRSYRDMFLIHQRVRGRDYRRTKGMREHLGRRFKYPQDLSVRRLGRLADGKRDVLPNHVGQNAQWEGHRLSGEQLTELGREAARKAGHPEQAVAYGFFEAAKLNPLEVEPEKVRTLVRMALFDIAPSESVPSQEVIEIVWKRVSKAIDAHLEDSREAFDKWFFGPNNSLVKQIAQQKRKPGGKLPREEVRQALLYLGWQAYEYIGPCVHALMRTIKNSMPEPLNDEERQLFGHMHESQPYYGGFPVALLAERWDFLHPAVVAIWDEPQDQAHIRVLHRLLDYYSSMVAERRAADRQSKQRSRGGVPASPRKVDADNTGVADDGGAAEGPASEEGPRPSKTHTGGQSQLIDNLHAPRSSEEGPFARIAEYLRERNQIECAAGCARWEYRREGESEDSVTILLRCECGRVDQKIQLSMEEFTEHAEKVLGRPRLGPDDSSTDDTEPSSES